MSEVWSIESINLLVKSVEMLALQFLEALQK